MHVIESRTLEFQSFIDQQEYWCEGDGGGEGTGPPGAPPWQRPKS